jgi:hypothetical protein
MVRSQDIGSTSIPLSSSRYSIAPAHTSLTLRRKPTHISIRLCCEKHESHQAPAPDAIPRTENVVQMPPWAKSFGGQYLPCVSATDKEQEARRTGKEMGDETELTNLQPASQIQSRRPSWRSRRTAVRQMQRISCWSMA